MDFIPIFPGLEHDRQVRRIAREVDTHPDFIVLALYKLWSFAFSFRKDGNVSDLAGDRALLSSIWPSYGGDVVGLFESMMDNGFIDRDHDFTGKDGDTYTLHNWFIKGAGRLFAKREAELSRKKSATNTISRENSAGNQEEFTRKSSGNQAENTRNSVVDKTRQDKTETGQERTETITNTRRPVSDGPTIPEQLVQLWNSTRRPDQPEVKFPLSKARIQAINDAFYNYPKIPYWEEVFKIASETDEKFTAMNFDLAIKYPDKVRDGNYRKKKSQSVQEKRQEGMCQPDEPLKLKSLDFSKAK